jgi:hypothetical protein
LSINEFLISNPSSSLGFVFNAAFIESINWLDADKEQKRNDDIISAL